MDFILIGMAFIIGVLLNIIFRMRKTIVRLQDSLNYVKHGELREGTYWDV